MGEGYVIICFGKEDCDTLQGSSYRISDMEEQKKKKTLPITLFNTFTIEKGLLMYESIW